MQRVDWLGSAYDWHWSGFYCMDSLTTRQTSWRLNQHDSLQWRHNERDGVSNLMVVYWSLYTGADQRKHQSSASLAFVRGIHWWPVNSPHKGRVTRKMFPFDHVIMSAKEVVHVHCHIYCIQFLLGSMQRTATIVVMKYHGNFSTSLEQPSI